MWVQRGAAAAEQAQGHGGERGGDERALSCGASADGELHLPRLHHRRHGHLSRTTLLGFPCAARLIPDQSGSGF